MNRVLRIELRRSAAAGAALILLLAGAVLLHVAPQRWSVGWMQLAMTQRDHLLLLWPLALAAGAWQAHREHRTNVAELFASTARPRPQRVLPALGALGIAVVGAYLATLAVAAPRIVDTAGYLPPASVVVVAVGALALVAAVWFGLAVGRLVPSPVTAPALAVAGIALLLAGPFAFGDRPWLAMLFLPSYHMSQFSDFQTVAGGVSAAQGVWLAALAVTGVVAFAAGRRRTRALALLPAVLGAALGLLVMPRGADYVDIPIDPVAQELVCTDDTPRVCVSRVHSGLLPEVTPIARRALALLSRLPDAPTTAQEDTRVFIDGSTPPPPSPDTVLIPVKADRDGHLAHAGNVLPAMLQGALAMDVVCPDGQDTDEAKAAAYWLLGREPVAAPGELPEEQGEAVRLWQGLRQLPAPEAAARVAAFRDTARACADTTGLLPGSSR